MKFLLETTGKFQLVDYGQEMLIIQHKRPTVSEQTQFIALHAAAGRVRLLAEVNDEATDAEWEKYLNDSDGDVELAKAAFLMSFPAAPARAGSVEVEETPQVTPSGKGKGKGRKGQ